MAVLPASLAGCGVGKSGSPAPKSTTSTPCRFSFSASAATFIVGDAATRPIRSANITFPLFLLLQSRHDNFRDQTPDLSTERKDFLDDPRADVRVLLGRHHEHRFHVRAQAAVHQCHLK